MEFRNIRKLEPNLDGLYKLDVRTFEHKDGTTDHGLSPREVQKIIPELVALDSSGNPVAVKHMTLIMLLLAEIQRLRLRIEELD